jgi:dipeptidase E
MCFDNTGFSELLPELVKTKVYVGSSAGSMVVGNRVSTEAYRRIYGEAGTFGTESYLGLVDLAIKPHFNSPEWPNNREVILLEVTQGFEGVLYGLSDSSALKMVDGVVTTIGDDFISIIGGVSHDA